MALAASRTKRLQTLLTVVALASAVCDVSVAQTVPEGVHELANGPTEMCGLTGRNAADFIAQARQSSGLRAVTIPSNRFEMFEGGDPIIYQMVITLPSEPAFPAASCRELYEEGGSLRMKRSMRCDAGRAECDALFLEFQALDAQLTRELQGGSL